MSRLRSKQLRSYDGVNKPYGFRVVGLVRFLGSGGG